MTAPSFSRMSNSRLYGGVARRLHWAIAFLILLQYLSKWAWGVILPVTVLRPYHEAAGVIVIVLAVLRLLWWANDRVRPGDETLGWEKWPSRLVKWGLMALGIAVPLIGYVALTTLGRPLQFGLFNIPQWLPTDVPYARQLFHLHGNLAYVMLAVLGLHIGGALRHHFILRDDVLNRMIPGALVDRLVPAGIRRTLASLGRR